MIDEAQKKEILAGLPIWIEQDAAFRVMLARLLRGEFAAKEETESRFDRLLDELRCDREAQARKWDEAKAESDRRWAEQDKRWEEQDRKWEETHQEFQRVHATIGKLDREVDAMGTRWGISSERSFRCAPKAFWNRPSALRCSISTSSMRQARYSVAPSKSS